MCTRCVYTTFIEKRTKPRKPVRLGKDGKSENNTSPANRRRWRKEKNSNGVSTKPMEVSTRPKNEQFFMYLRSRRPGNSKDDNCRKNRRNSSRCILSGAGSAGLAGLAQRDTGRLSGRPVSVYAMAVVVMIVFDLTICLHV